jgi:hypothetical protein
MATSTLSIVVPVKVADDGPLAGFADCYRHLLTTVANLELLVADDSPPDVFARLEAGLRGLPGVDHYRPDDAYRTGSNGNINSVRSAIPRSRGQFVLVIDDDYRPTPESIALLRSRLAPGGSLHALTRLLRPNLGDLIERTGMFVGMALSSGGGYFCGNLAFDRTLVPPGFPRDDALFDELACVRELRRLGASYTFVAEPWYPVTPHPPGKVLQQRVRYAYETLDNPKRAAFYLSIVPVLAVLAIVAPLAALGAAAALRAAFAALALIGQWRHRGLAPRLTWLLGPVYLWLVSIAIWVAVGFQLTGGVPFGGRRVRRPA